MHTTTHGPPPDGPLITTHPGDECPVSCRNYALVTPKEVLGVPKEGTQEDPIMDPIGDHGDGLRNPPKEGYPLYAPQRATRGNGRDPVGTPRSTLLCTQKGSKGVISAHDY
jgi:hypothetical protein